MQLDPFSLVKQSNFSDRQTTWLYKRSLATETAAASHEACRNKLDQQFNLLSLHLSFFSSLSLSYIFYVFPSYFLQCFPFHYFFIYLPRTSYPTFILPSFFLFLTFPFPPLQNDLSFLNFQGLLLFFSFTFLLLPQFSLSLYFSLVSLV